MSEVKQELVKRPEDDWLEINPVKIKIATDRRRREAAKKRRKAYRKKGNTHNIPTAKSEFKKLSQRMRLGLPPGVGMIKGVSTQPSKKINPLIKSGKLRPDEDDNSKELVSLMSSCGIKKASMARMLGVDPRAFNTYFSEEIECGLDLANLKVAQALYRNAILGDTNAQKFWLKSQAGFRETEVPDLSSSALEGVSDVEIAQRLGALLLQNSHAAKIFGARDVTDITPSSPVIEGSGGTASEE